MIIETELFERRHGNTSPEVGVAKSLCTALGAIFMVLLNWSGLVLAVGDGPAPYAVGSATRFIHDDSRGFDTVAGVDGGIRVLIAEVWYPVDKTLINSTTASPTWGDYVFGDIAVHRRMITETSFLHLTPLSLRKGVTDREVETAIVELFSRQRASYRGLPLADDRDRFPIVVMSHGDAGSRYNMVTAAQRLAEWGFVVIAADHTGNSPFAMVGRDPALKTDSAFGEQMATVLPLLDGHGVYGHDLSLGQSYAPDLAAEPGPEDFLQLDLALADRVDDLRAVLDELERMQLRGPLAGRLDLEHIGLMGRSFGGATTLVALQQEPRFKAGVAVVPAVLPGLRHLLPPEMLSAVPQDSPLFGENGSAFFGQSKPVLMLAGAQDALIIGLESVLASMAGTTGPTADNRQPMLRAAFESATGFAAFGMLDRTNHSSLGVSGAYWWPLLKPDTFPDPLQPGVNYVLMPAEKAHRLQADLALHFFRGELLGDVGSTQWFDQSADGDSNLQLEVRRP